MLLDVSLEKAVAGLGGAWAIDTFRLLFWPFNCVFMPWLLQSSYRSWPSSETGRRSLQQPLFRQGGDVPILQRMIHCQCIISREACPRKHRFVSRGPYFIFFIFFIFYLNIKTQWHKYLQTCTRTMTIDIWQNTTRDGGRVQGWHLKIHKHYFEQKYDSDY